MTCGFESAPTALPVQKHGCGGAENEKAPANAEAQIGFEALYSTHNASGLQGQQVNRLETVMFRLLMAAKARRH